MRQRQISLPVANGTTGIMAFSFGLAGIGTTSPQNKLEVVGSTTFAGGVNAS